MDHKKIALLILDGWGIGSKDHTDAAYVANTPFLDQLMEKHPFGLLEASGLAVGLPSGQMGNSEVGHMNLGAGRVVFQELGRINNAIETGEFYLNPELQKGFEFAIQHNKKVHFIGLVSDGGVHAHINHLKALCIAAKNAGVKESYIHAFLDGRDTDPQAGVGYIADLEAFLPSTNTKIASLIGRYYAMDRDSRWERVKQAYDLLTLGKGRYCNSPIQAIKLSYDNGITDEFLLPVAITENNQVRATIEPGDVVICFNFRTDRGREITAALTQNDYPDFEMHKLPLYFITMTAYDENFENINVLYKKDDLSLTLGEVLQLNGKNQIRIAETEKYPHVTFFFSGGRETEFQNERRIMIPSPKVATYDLLPEMSAFGITNAILPELQSKWADFICLNFANPDMVGHTGNFNAVIKAVETVDTCTKVVVEKAIENGYSLIILADHGNSEFMINPDGTPNTAHTTNLVPCIIIDKDVHKVNNGKLGDVAPTICHLLNIKKPESMTGVCLI